jgi:hypothetical protein
MGIAVLIFKALDKTSLLVVAISFLIGSIFQANNRRALVKQQRRGGVPVATELLLFPVIGITGSDVRACSTAHLSH